MIAFETIQLFRKRDFLLVLSLSFLFALFSYILSLFNLEGTFHLRLGFFYFFLVSVVLFAKKAGSAVIYCLFVFLMNHGALIIVLSRFQSFIVFLSVGVLFELFFLIIKLEVKSLPLDLVLGSAFSSALIPFVLIFFAENKSALYVSAINIAVINFFTAVIGACSALAIWYKLRSAKNMLKFEYE